MVAVMTKGEFIRFKRMANGVRVVDICNSTGISEATLYAMEVGTRGINPRIVEDLISSIGIDDKYRTFLLYPEDILDRDVMSKGEFLKLKRLDQGINVTDLSEHTGVSVALISLIENGTRSVTERIYNKLAPKLNISDVPYELFDSCELKVNVRYSMDRLYEIPIFGGVSLDNEIDSKENNIRWMRKEYTLLDQSYKDKTVVERTNSVEAQSLIE